jgi:transposase-like protein
MREGYVCPICGTWVNEKTHLPICQHEWVAEYSGQQTTSSLPSTKWRCKKCLETRTTYD